jgi:hypothetical protein
VKTIRRRLKDNKERLANSALGYLRLAFSTGKAVFGRPQLFSEQGNVKDGHASTHEGQGFFLSQQTLGFAGSLRKIILGLLPDQHS